AVRDRLDAEHVFAPDIFFTSHFHRDHIGALGFLLDGPDGQRGTPDDRVPKQGIFDRGVPLATGGFTEARYQQDTLGLRTTVAPGQVFDIGGGVTLKVIATDGFVDGAAGRVPIDTSDENQRSVVLLLTAPRRNGGAPFTMLLPGDLSGGGDNTVDVED